MLTLFLTSTTSLPSYQRPLDVTLQQKMAAERAKKISGGGIIGHRKDDLANHIYLLKQRFRYRPDFSENDSDLLIRLSHPINPKQAIFIDDFILDISHQDFLTCFVLDQNNHVIESKRHWNVTCDLHHEIDLNLHNTKKIGADSDILVALKDGKVYSYGVGSTIKRNTVISFGLGLGLGRNTEAAFPKHINGLPYIQDISTGEEYSLALANNGDIYAWGDNTSGAACHGINNPQFVPKKIEGLPPISTIKAGENRSLFLTRDGRFFYCGRDISYIDDFARLRFAVYSPKQVQHALGRPIIQAATGQSHVILLLDNGQVATAGANFSGQLGLGHKEEQSPIWNSDTNNPDFPYLENKDLPSPSQSIEFFENIPEVYDQYSLFPENSQPQLNLVPGIDNAVAISAYNDYSLVLKSDGSVWFFGEETTTPIQIPDIMVDVVISYLSLASTKQPKETDLERGVTVDATARILSHIPGFEIDEAPMVDIDTLTYLPNVPALEEQDLLPNKPPEERKKTLKKVCAVQ